MTKTETAIPDARLTEGLLRLKRDGVLHNVWIDAGRIRVALPGVDPLPFPISHAFAELAVAAPTPEHARAAILSARALRVQSPRPRQTAPWAARRAAYLSRAGRPEDVQ